MSKSKPIKQMGKFIYPFFMIHMLAFGASGFAMAYFSKEPDATFLYLHGGIAITVYIIFYLALFGIDEIIWLAINSVLGILGIATQISWLLEVFGKNLNDYPIHIHVIPFIYFILYTFLLRQAVLDFSGARDNPQRKQIVESLYVAGSMSISAFFYFF